VSSIHPVHIIRSLAARAAAGIVLGAVLAVSAGAQERAPAQAEAGGRRAEPDERYVIEYYYKVKWGLQREFIELYRKNHYPILKRQMEKGQILEIVAVGSRYHSPEESRWDYRVTVVYANLVAAHTSGGLSDDEMKKLFPDRAAFEREERRRFEVLDAHWDLPLVGVRLSR
jgi:hypothetical protein